MALFDRFKKTDESESRDGFLHALVGAAYAEVLHLGCDLAAMVPRIHRADGGHDHTALAVAALRHLAFQPGLLHRVAIVVREALNRSDFFPDSGRHVKNARVLALPVNEHCACAADLYAATVFRASESENVPKHPEERGAAVGDVSLIVLTVNIEGYHAFLSSTLRASRKFYIVK